MSSERMLEIKFLDYGRTLMRHFSAIKEMLDESSHFSGFMKGNVGKAP